VAKAKKRTARKTSRAKKTTRAAAPRKKRADASRLDTGPLQDHLRQRIKDLEGKRAGALAADAGGDRTLERLKEALSLLEDICHPSMTVPI
jgi:hypothetical protein